MPFNYLIQIIVPFEKKLKTGQLKFHRISWLTRLTRFTQQVQGLRESQSDVVESWNFPVSVVC